jgi:hypothetical protein
MNANPYDFNFAGVKPDIRETIPAGTPLYLALSYTPGGVGPAGALTKSKTSDVEYLKAEFTVLRGPYKGRKFWSNMTVTGGDVDEKGQSKAGAITRKSIRLLLDSAQGLSSKDDSPEAAAKRVLPEGFKSLQGLRFVALAKVEKEKDGYPEKNTLGSILTVDMKNYPTEQQLDNPPKPGTPATPAAPPPQWSGAGISRPDTGQAAPTTNGFPAPTAMQAAVQPGNDLPAWAK